MKYHFETCPHRDKPVETVRCEECQQEFAPTQLVFHRRNAHKVFKLPPNESIIDGDDAAQAAVGDGGDARGSSVVPPERHARGAKVLARERMKAAVATEQVSDKRFDKMHAVEDDDSSVAPSSTDQSDTDDEELERSNC